MPIEEIEGYPEFIRDTKKIEQAFPEAMRVAAGDFAREWISLAQSMASTDYAVQASQEFIVADSGDGVEISNSSVLFFGSEFGGQARPETMQFDPFTGNEGYWFYPARRANEEQLAEIWGKGVDVAMSPWNRNG